MADNTSKSKWVKLGSILLFIISLSTVLGIIGNLWGKYFTGVDYCNKVDELGMIVKNHENRLVEIEKKDAVQQEINDSVKEIRKDVKTLLFLIGK